jgi:hypothetical protein
MRFYLRDFDFFLLMGPGPDKLESPVLLMGAVFDLLDFLALLLRSAIADLGAFPPPTWLVLLLSDRGAP